MTSSKKKTPVQEPEITIEAEDETSQDVVRKLRSRLKKCEQEKQEYLTGWQRSKADFINARKDDEKRRENFIKFAEENTIRELLTLADSFDGLFGHKEFWEKVDKNLQKGIENIYTQLLSILSSRGLKIIETKNKKFSHVEHEAIGEIKVDKKEKEGTIMEEIRRGYKLNGKIIRPAQVKVGKT